MRIRSHVRVQDLAQGLAANLQPDIPRVARRGFGVGSV
ncbi:predicted protein [Sclerotinia sclerotiorum 1980 UF-70]|uniref:Uncharacterized protein n=1 Tax=Sclerotinia sclerotiorum (strain ATCC 18683 / 1980 / Ss-1) TaxID=665079 RepID=A7EZ03_SCLS1|nr:predicted protein [Sclerotinia sclerotiorum 1980 UF-70]EDN94695.1 predicted protein [Sclerotinia sclerotiorum 1980 UF-70]